MADRGKSGKESAGSSSSRSSRDRQRIRPVNLPEDPPAPLPQGPREQPRQQSSHPGRDRWLEFISMPSIREQNRATPQPETRRIIIDVPTGPRAPNRSVRNRISTPFYNPNQVDERIVPSPPSTPTFDVSQGIVSAGLLGSRPLIPESLLRSQSNYEFTSTQMEQNEPASSRRSLSPERDGERRTMRRFRTFFRSFTDRIQGFINTRLRHHETRESTSVPVANETPLSPRASLASTALNLTGGTSSEYSSDEERFRRPVRNPQTSSSSTSASKQSDEHAESETSRSQIPHRAQEPTFETTARPLIPRSRSESEIFRAPTEYQTSHSGDREPTFEPTERTIAPESCLEYELFTAATGYQSSHLTAREPTLESAERTITPENRPELGTPASIESESLHQLSEDTPNASRPPTPKNVVNQLVPSELVPSELALVREDRHSEYELTEDQVHVYSRPASHVELCHIRLNSSAKVNINCDEAGSVMTCIRYTPDNYDFDDGAVSDTASSSEDES